MFKSANHSESAGKVCPEDSGLESLDVAPNVRLWVEDMAVFRQLVEDRLLLVGKDDVGVVRLHHQQGLTQRPRALPQNLTETTV